MPDRHRKNIFSFGCVAPVAIIILLLLSTAFYLRPSSPGQQPDKMPITHILLVSFKPTAKPEAVQRV